ncbi:hypothetical protein O181_094951 [Austropuccinia psidii MF-1]|uniref:Uncharacterized protein n=1 Tax=Austropuccinia psidii MF-1 TaxID=1389203 RepID=A0A9Q3J470_9BASI|nr:hypothetical protein [Austropuccinia psidii MF-1]
MVNWPPWVFYGIHAITPFNGHFKALGHILPSLAFLANSHFTNPQAFIFDFGPGGHFVFYGPPGPLAIILEFKATPFIIGVLAHLGPLRLLRPVGGDSWSTVRGPRPKGAKGASHPGPKPQLGPSEPSLATTSLDPKVTKNLMDTILAINHVGPNFGHGPP